MKGSVKCFFGEYIVKTGSDTYGFMESPWRICVRGCVSQEGKLLETSQQPALQMFLAEQRLKDLATVGELVKGTLRRSVEGSIPQSATPEKLSRGFAGSMRNCMAGRKRTYRSLEQLLGCNNGWPKENSIQQYGYRMRGCAYLEMLRNAYSHMPAEIQQVIKIISSW